MASPGSGVGRGGYMKLIVEHKMTQNNTLNKVNVATTELLQNTNMFGEATAESRCQILCNSKVN